MLLLEDGWAIIHDLFPVCDIKNKSAQLQLVKIFGIKHRYWEFLGFLAGKHWWCCTTGLVASWLSPHDTFRVQSVHSLSCFAGQQLVRVLQPYDATKTQLPDKIAPVSSTLPTTSWLKALNATERLEKQERSRAIRGLCFSRREFLGAGMISRKAIAFFRGSHNPQAFSPFTLTFSHTWMRVTVRQPSAHLPQECRALEDLSCPPVAQRSCKGPCKRLRVCSKISLLFSRFIFPFYWTPNKKPFEIARWHPHPFIYKTAPFN